MVRNGYYVDEFRSMGATARSKSNIAIRQPSAFTLASMLAGVYIGFGVLLAFTVGGMIDQPFAKLIMGCVFGIALSLVTICGAELFTGNNMVLMAGRLQRTIDTKKMVGLWAACWFGNLSGATLLAIIFDFTGLNAGMTLFSIGAAAMAKVTAAPLELFFRGVLCNILVCLAVWAGFRTKSDTAKLIMVFWCLLAFFTTGFEHSVANMTLLTAAFLGNAITLTQMFYNLIIVTAGNLCGGVLLACIYNKMAIGTIER